MKILGIVVSGLVFLALVCFIPLSHFFRRRSQSGKGTTPSRSRDVDDNVIWELGRNKGITDISEQSEISVRQFFKKAAMGAAVAFVGWSATKGEFVSGAAKLLAEKNKFPDASKGKPTQSEIPPHNDTRVNTHSDGNYGHVDAYGESHFDSDAHYDTHTDTYDA